MRQWIEKLAHARQSEECSETRTFEGDGEGKCLQDLLCYHFNRSILHILSNYFTSKVIFLLQVLAFQPIHFLMVVCLHQMPCLGKMCYKLIDILTLTLIQTL
jgi:hypothetical protein